MPFFLIFVLFPLLELWLLIKVGAAIGPLTTVALTIFTAMVGVALLRLQGLSALASAQAKLAAGESAADELVGGVFLALGGLLLLVPGFITDFLGLLCLTPGLRHGLVALMLKRARFRTAHTGASRVIEGEYRRER